MLVLSHPSVWNWDRIRPLTCSTLLRAASGDDDASSCTVGRDCCCVRAYNPNGFVNIVVVGTGAKPAWWGSSCRRKMAAAASHAWSAHNAAMARNGHAAHPNSTRVPRCGTPVGSSSLRVPRPPSPLLTKPQTSNNAVAFVPRGTIPLRSMPIRLRRVSGTEWASRGEPIVAPSPDTARWPYTRPPPPRARLSLEWRPCPAEERTWTTRTRLPSRARPAGSSGCVDRRVSRPMLRFGGRLKITPLSFNTNPMMKPKCAWYVQKYHRRRQ